MTAKWKIEERPANISNRFSIDDKKSREANIKQEPMSRSLQLPYKAYITAFLQTDLFLEYLFFCERKSVPVQ